MTGVMEKLKDPSTASFGDIYAAIDGKHVISVCGFVNGRNSLGAYTGFVPYTGVLGTNAAGQQVFGVVDIGTTPADTSSQAILILCKRLKIMP